MGWKLRKDKLRAEVEEVTPSTEPPAETAVEASTADAAVENEDASPTFAAPFDMSESAFQHYDPNRTDSDSEAFLLHSNTPAAAPSEEEESNYGNSPAFDPISFDAPIELEELPAFDTAAETASDDAPTFGVDSPAFALGGDLAQTTMEPASTAFGLVTEAEPSSLVTPIPAEEALPEEATDDLGAFAPFAQTTVGSGAEAIAVGTEDPAELSDLEPEVGAMPFDPQSPIVADFSPDAPTAAEEVEDAISFEPAFEAPDAFAGQATENAELDDTFMDREALAAGLVTTEAGSGLPQVAPFVLGNTESGDLTDDEHGPHSLVLRLGNLSATLPLTKPVTTIGRPDKETGNYPDVEVELDDGVSRRHAEVRQSDNDYYLVDVGSTNGTVLNGQMLSPDQPARLMRGDHIHLGERTEIVFE